ncbi:MAG: glycogen/starch/alpha-glucan phosphorylase, partial [Candidatus Aminicenantes bacterium]|nr:glycogen/starch/alpha-glucan phosphorylase [Candidatus Aminicenantes bacterium]
MTRIVGPSRVRTGRTAEAIARAFLDNLHFVRGCKLGDAAPNDLYMALAYTVRDRMLAAWIKGLRGVEGPARGRIRKTVAYMSAEFLPGPHLANGLLCLGLTEPARRAMSGLGLDLDALIEQEEEPGLGNGGLGRLASCYLDSLATLGVNAIGYGIRYEFGIFDQEIREGWQAEIADTWLRHGNPWEIAKTELCQEVGLGGRTEPFRDVGGRYRVRWVPSTTVKGIPYDNPIIGYGGAACATMRLWKAEAPVGFDLRDFNAGDYYAAVEEKTRSETITKILYPNDEIEAGKQLRLLQQHFFVSCSLKDMLRLHLSR